MREEVSVFKFRSSSGAVAVEKIENSYIFFYIFSEHFTLQSIYINGRQIIILLLNVLDVLSAIY